MEQFRSGLEEAWANVATFVPRLIAFLLIVLIGYLLAKLLEKVLDRALEAVGFDRWVERGGVERALERSSYDASSLLSRIVFYVIMLFVLQLAFGIFGPNPISDLLTGVIGYLPRVFVAILIVVIGAAVAAAAKDIIQGAGSGLEYGRALGLLASGAILVVTAFAALDQLRIAPTIVTGLFYALLAIVVGSAVVAFGGGGIPVARRYVDRWAKRADRESDRIRDEVQTSSDEPTERLEARTGAMRPPEAEHGNGHARRPDDGPSAGGSRER